MKNKLWLLSLLIMLSTYSSAQIVDKYGFNIGTSYSNQTWDYDLSIFEHPKDYKLGISLFLSAEKNIYKAFNIRTEIGYIQKGFKNNKVFVFGNDRAINSNENVIYHDIAANAALKITPVDFILSPYFLFGLQSDYMIAYTDIKFKEPGNEASYSMYTAMIKKFNKMNLGGILGLGFEYNDLLYLEVEYNPSITHSFQDKALEIKDVCWIVKLGLHLNNLNIE